MAVRTLLELTQSILSSWNGNNVTDIDGTPESTQVVTILEDVYYEIIQEEDWPFLQREGQLEDVGDGSQPVKIKIPDTYNRIQYLRYDVKKSTDTNENWKNLTYLDPEVFISRLQSANASATNIDTITTANGVKFFVRNDQAPSFWTSFDDEFIFFDSYDSDEDTTIDETKTFVLATVEPAFSRSNSAVQDLPGNFFSYYLEMSRARAWEWIKEKSNTAAERAARRARIKLRAFYGIRSNRQEKLQRYGKRSARRRQGYSGYAWYRSRSY